MLFAAPDFMFFKSLLTDFISAAIKEDVVGDVSKNISAAIKDSGFRKKWSNICV